MVCIKVWMTEECDSNGVGVSWRTDGRTDRHDRQITRLPSGCRIVGFDKENAGSYVK
jgi:hypothetical protein